MTIGRKTKIAITIAGVPLVLTGMWGVERSIRLPGDEILPGAGTMGTKAISIHVTPDEIWPWLVQMGVGRAGMYSYDWIDRIVGSGDAVDGHSATRIHPELQDRNVGDQMVFHPPTGLAYTVAMVSAPRVIVYRGQSVSPVTWTFYLLPSDDGTRLITRWRGSKANGAAETVANAVFGTMDFVMEQRMLTRIKELAESHAAAAMSRSSSTY